MGKLVKVESNPIIELKHSEHNDLDISKPFQKDTLLFITFISKEPNKMDEFDDLVYELETNEQLQLFREPNNNNSDAVVIKTSDGTKLGYIPSLDTLIPAKLMDAGKCLYAKVKNIRKPYINYLDKSDHNGYHARVDVEIYIKD
jgi:hypothetical protein